MSDGSVFSFTMSGPNGLQRFDFDADPELLLGDQTQIIRSRTGVPALQWVRRVVNVDIEAVDEQDYLLMAYLARYRTNPLLDWNAFIATVAPLTFRVVADEAPKPKPAARTRKAAASS